VNYRNGAIDQQIDSIIQRDFPNIPATFRQRGKTTACIRFHYGFGGSYEAKQDDHQRVYGAASYNPLFRYRGAKVFDPRDAQQVIDDQTTWKWSDNAALCAVRFLTHEWPDMQLVPIEKIDVDQLIKAADICDKWERDKAGNAFRRHTINGVVESAQDAFQVIEDMEVAFDGKLTQSGGKIYPLCFEKSDPIATFHDEMLIGGVEAVTDADTQQSPNIVKTQFISEDRDYQLVEGPVLRDAALIAADQRPNEITVAGNFIQGHPRIQRLANKRIKQGRLGRTLSMGATVECSQWLFGDVIRVFFKRGPLARFNGIYKVEGIGFDEHLSAYRVDLREFDKSVYDFNPATDEQDFVVEKLPEAA